MTPGRSDDCPDGRGRTAGPLGDGMAGADWKEFGENKGEKTQVDRQTEGRSNGGRGVRQELRPIENRVCWKSCCDNEVVAMFARFQATNYSASSSRGGIDLTL